MNPLGPRTPCWNPRAFFPSSTLRWQAAQFIVTLEECCSYLFELILQHSVGGGRSCSFVVRGVRAPSGAR